MMTGLLTILHPTFDALSAYADLSEIDAARSRVGRHVARCAECRATVDEIHRFGSDARAAGTEGVPAGLWSRIADASASAANEESKSRETPPPDATPWEAAPSLRPTRHWPVPMRRSLARIGAGLAVAAAALVAVVLAGGGARALIAGVPNRLQLTPFRPAPGAHVRVRFTPSPRFAAYDQVVLIGQYAQGSKYQMSDFYFGGKYDSLATLRKASDGAMVGDFTVPADFRAVSLVVVDASGRHYEADGLFSWILVGGDRKGRPVLASLLAAASLNALYGSNARAEVLDTLQRYFPDHPAGFATARHYRGRGVFADMVKFFQGAEGKYLSFNARLEKLPSLDADRLSAMIDFAYEIQETGEAKKWTMRLVREHPADARAFLYYTRMIHELELKEPPADSVRPYIPLLDTLYLRANAGDVSDAYGYARRYGDEAMQRRWALRSLGRRDYPRLALNIDDRWLADREIRQKAESLLRDGLSGGCEQSRWMARGWMSPQAKRRNCVGSRARALTTLSTIALIEGDVAHALSLADSSVGLNDSAGLCWSAGGLAARADALLARGDTLGAAREYAMAYGYDNWQSIDARKAAAKRIGGAVDSTRWAAFDEAGRVATKRCMDQATLRNALERGDR